MKAMGLDHSNREKEHERIFTKDEMNELNKLAEQAFGDPEIEKLPPEQKLQHKLAKIRSWRDSERASLQKVQQEYRRIELALENLDSEEERVRNEFEREAKSDGPARP
jgi:hypothetical protein